MIDIIRNIVFLIVNLFSLYIMKNFFDNFLIHYRFSKKVVFLAYMGLYIINSALVFLHINILTRMLLSYLITFGLSLCYRTSLKNQITFTAFILILGVLTETIFGAIFPIKYFQNIDDQQSIQFMIFIVMSKILFYIVVIIVCKIFGKADDFEIPFSYWLIIIVVPIGSLFISGVLLSLSESVSFKNKELLSLSVTLLLLLNLLVIYLYERVIRLSNVKTQNALLSLQNDFYSKQYQLMKDTAAEIMQLKHDLRGHMTSIKAYIGSGDIKEIDVYINNLMGKIEYKGNFSNSGIMAIDGIINYKMYEAERLGAKINVNIDIPDTLEVDPIDITAILSNILDNAVEACQYVKVDRRFININLLYEKKNLFINVINSCNESMTEKSNNGQRTTKRNENGEIHGLGLDSVKRIVQKYDGNITLSTGPQKFVCGILLYSVENPN